MIQNLTEPEKKHIETFRKRGMEYPYIAAEIVVGRHLMEFVHLQGEIEAYFEELGKRDKKWWQRKGDKNGERRKTATTYLYIVLLLLIHAKNKKEVNKI